MSQIFVSSTILGVIVLLFLGKISYFLPCFSCLKVNVFMTYLKKSTQYRFVAFVTRLHELLVLDKYTHIKINLYFILKTGLVGGICKDMQHTSSSYNEWHVTLSNTTHY